MIDNKEEKNIENLQEISNQENVEDLAELENAPENKEAADFDHQKIREALESIELDDSDKTDALAQANNLQSGATQEKIDKLLLLAKNKNIEYAVQVAKNLNDPYILDTFHDILVKEGYYKKFVK